MTRNIAGAIHRDGAACLRAIAFLPRTLKIAQHHAADPAVKGSLLRVHSEAEALFVEGQRLTEVLLGKAKLGRFERPFSGTWIAFRRGKTTVPVLLVSRKTGASCSHRIEALTARRRFWLFLWSCCSEKQWFPSRGPASNEFQELAEWSMRNS